jgi:phage portal protein BeeE
MTATIERQVQQVVGRINALAAERTALYRTASAGWTPQQRARLKEVDGELAELWEERRRLQAGHTDPSAVPVRYAA